MSLTVFHTIPTPLGKFSKVDPETEPVNKIAYRIQSLPENCVACISGPNPDILDAANSAAEELFKKNSLIVYPKQPSQEIIAAQPLGIYGLCIGTKIAPNIPRENQFVDLWDIGPHVDSVVTAAAHIAQKLDDGLTIPQARTVLHAAAQPLQNDDGVGEYSLISYTHPTLIPIDPYIKLQPAIHLICGRRANRDELEYYFTISEDEGFESALEDLVRASRMNFDWKRHDLPIAQRVQSHYHFLLGREPSTQELLESLQKIQSVKYRQGNTPWKLCWDDFTADFFNECDENVSLPTMIL